MFPSDVLIIVYAAIFHAVKARDEVYKRFDSHIPIIQFIQHYENKLAICIIINICANELHFFNNYITEMYLY